MAWQCPHPEKLRWPADDEWGPFVKACELNRWAHTTGQRSIMTVYRCGGATGDHWHLTDQVKGEEKHRAFLERTGRVSSGTTPTYRQEPPSEEDPDHYRSERRAARRRRMRQRRQARRDRRAAS